MSIVTLRLPRHSASFPSEVGRCAIKPRMGVGRESHCAECVRDHCCKLMHTGEAEC